MSAQKTAYPTRASAANERLKRRMLIARLKSEHQGTIARLKSGLQMLEVNIQRARRSLEAGEGLDAHLIVNASSITEDIGRWNLARDLLPLVEEDT